MRTTSRRRAESPAVLDGINLLPPELRRLLSLRPIFRDCFVLRILVQLPPEECADLLNISITEYEDAFMRGVEPAPAPLFFLRRPAMPKGRVESFSDCVIAFAITLLILDIHLQDVGTTTNSAEMIHAIMALAPHFLIYVISFLICTVAWIAHHEFIHDLDHVDSRLLWLNSLYLMWIAFLPFPTALLGNHPEQPVAVAIYGSVCAVTCLSFSAGVGMPP